MAMFHYRSDGEVQGNTEIPVQWKAEIVDKKLIVTGESNRYTVGEFQDYSDYIDDNCPIWYSFDYNTYNFHIVPDIETALEYQARSSKLMKEIIAVLESLGLILKGKSMGSKEWTKCHRFKYLDKDEYEYLISFDTMTCEDGIIKNYFGKIQFYRYLSKINQINWTVEEDGSKHFKMMYPCTYEEGRYSLDKATGHCVYNTALTVKDSGKEIAKAFVAFINGELVKF